MSRLDTLVADAAQARAAGEPLPSPCVQICRIDARTGWCEGCWRRLEEIGGWMTMDEDARWAVWQRIAQRRATTSTVISTSYRPTLIWRSSGCRARWKG